MFLSPSPREFEDIWLKQKRQNDETGKKETVELCCSGLGLLQFVPL